VDQLLLATWLFGYRLCLFSKGHNFHIRSPFSMLFFLKQPNFFEIFPSRPLVSFSSAYFNMASLNDLLLTNTNYFHWEGLYWITLGKEEEPTDDDKYAKWINKNDEARGLIRMSISLDLRFHLQGLDAPNEAWEKLEVVFGKHNIIRAH
jgi:hypothetical protein